jgi:hypothetical protein
MVVKCILETIKSLVGKKTRQEEHYKLEATGWINLTISEHAPGKQKINGELS